MRIARKTSLLFAVGALFTGLVLAAFAGEAHATPTPTPTPTATPTAAAYIFSDFDNDTPGQPPATGGAGEPSSVFGGGVLVQASANGIATQPLTVDDGSCDAGYFGGVTYDVVPPLTSGSLRVEATVAFNQITSGIFFDASVPAASITRLNFDGDGNIEANAIDIENYQANTPFRFRVDIDMDTKTWSVAIDDELNGFGDDPVVGGLQFINTPSLIDQVGRVYMSLFGGFGAWPCSGSRVVAYDDVLIEALEPTSTPTATPTVTPTATPTVTPTVTPTAPPTPTPFSDTDGDGIPDGTDNCPFVPNNSQTNSDPLPAGDACQCGDVNTDFIVDGLDAQIAREYLMGHAVLSGSFDPERCNVIGTSDCGVDDIFVLDRIAQGLPVILQNVCDAYSAP